MPSFYLLSSRSTPRRDAVYGGQDDLTAAIGWEEDGVTTVIFRKPASGAQVRFIFHIKEKWVFWHIILRFHSIFPILIILNL